jgi:organic hydroperoxide reductase OsmC/OhrA
VLRRWNAETHPVMARRSPLTTRGGRITAADERFVRAHLERTDGFRFSVSFPDLERAAPLTMDEAPPLGGGDGPNPAALVASAVGGCLAASLVFCLRKARVEPSGVVADATAHIVRNAAGRFRIGGVDVELSLSVAAEDQARFDRCLPIFEDFCIVTESVRAGVPVRVHVTPRLAAAVAQ